MAYNKYELWAEIHNDPEGRGYAAMMNGEIPDYVAIAADLNTAYMVRIRRVFTRENIVDALNANIAEFTALNIQKETRLWQLVDDLVAGELPVDGGTKALFETVFPSGDIHAALVALKNETVSRATFLGWPVVTVGDVIQAMNWAGGG